MGLFDLLYVLLTCPKTKQIQEAEIQFKWGQPCLNVYHCGDQLSMGPYGNLWIPEDYLCQQCLDTAKNISKSVNHETAWHKVFIHIDNGKFLEVLTEEEFSRQYGQIGTEHLLQGQALLIPDYKYRF